MYSRKSRWWQPAHTSAGAQCSEQMERFRFGAVDVHAFLCFPRWSCWQWILSKDCHLRSIIWKHKRSHIETDKGDLLWLWLAPRDILCQRVNVPLATKRILLLFYLKKFLPWTFWGTSIKISRRGTGKRARRKYLALPCFLWAMEGAVTDPNSFPAVPWGSAWRNMDSSPGKPAYQYSSRHADNVLCDGINYV